VGNITQEFPCGGCYLAFGLSEILLEPFWSAISMSRLRSPLVFTTPSECGDAQLLEITIRINIHVAGQAKRSRVLNRKIRRIAKA
jgi:hypothetical protein